MKISFLLLLLIAPLGVLAQDHTLRSPNERVEVRIKLSDKVNYSIHFDQKPVVGESAISLTVREHPAVGRDPKVLDSKKRAVDQIVTNVVPDKRRKIRDAYNELRLNFQGGYSLIWRVYDSGVAYRWVTDLPGDITISNELAEIALQPTDRLFYPEETSFYSHNERTYIKYAASELGDKLASLPVLVDSNSGVKLWISEADLYDYAGMWVRGNGRKGLTAVFPSYPLREEKRKDRDLIVSERADHIARTSGKRQFPWRVFGLAERDSDLLNNELVFLLSEDTRDDFSWVRPGKVAWDWWNANNIYGVDFKSGLNTATYKFYVDFAARYGLDHIILDEGWSRTTEDLLVSKPEIDLPELLTFAKNKNVGIILWVLWLPLEKDMEKILDEYQKWGVKGIKVDFMQRDDQKVVRFYERTAREAAKRKLLVDLHGAYKPTGMKRKYPNVLTSEGVKGLENSKWSKEITPSHNLMLPFTRMVAGPMDYTPGAMLNATENGFAINFIRPMSQGTRCHQLAMYVVYESSLNMLADSPSNYLREPEAMEFLSAVPTVWDETIPLDAKVGEYAVVARRSLKGEWFVGGMTDWKERDIEIDLSFLETGNYEARILQDGVNANQVASDFRKVIQTVKKGDKLKIKLASGGGFAIRLVKRRSV